MLFQIIFLCGMAEVGRSSRKFANYLQEEEMRLSYFHLAVVISKFPPSDWLLTHSRRVALNQRLHGFFDQLFILSGSVLFSKGERNSSSNPPRFFFLFEFLIERNFKKYIYFFFSIKFISSTDLSHRFNRIW